MFLPKIKINYNNILMTIFYILRTSLVRDTCLEDNWGTSPAVKTSCSFLKYKPFLYSFIIEISMGSAIHE